MNRKRRVVILILLAVLSLAGLALLMSLRRPRLYTVTILPSLGGARTIPHAINDRDQIVGLADTNGAGTHLFLWDRRKGMQDLGPADQGDYFLNNAGQIAGTMVNPNGKHRAFLWDPNEGRATLEMPGIEESFALGLNNHGQVVGYSKSDRHPMRAFRWDRTNGMQELSAFGEGWSRACVINDAGQIFALSSKGRSPDWPSFWDPRVATSAVTLPGNDFYDMNSDGCVVGRFLSFDSGDFAMVFWRSGTGIEELFPLPGPMGDAPRLNDACQILYSENRRSRLEWLSKKLFGPRRWTCLRDPHRGRIPLDAYLPRGMGSFLARDLNGKGSIIGVLQTRDGKRSRGVLLVPVPERWGR